MSLEAGLFPVGVEDGKFKHKLKYSEGMESSLHLFFSSPLPSPSSPLHQKEN